MTILLKVSEREEGVVALHLLTESLETHFKWEPVLGCEPSTYQPYVRRLDHCVTNAGDS